MFLTTSSAGIGVPRPGEAAQWGRCRPGCDRLRKLQDPVEGPGRHLQRMHRLADQRPAGYIKLVVGPDLGRSHPGVRAQVGALKAHPLPVDGSANRSSVSFSKSSLNSISPDWLSPSQHLGLN